MDTLRKRVGICLIMIIIVLFVSGGSDRNYGGVLVSRVIRVYDGDTFYCDVDQWPAVVGKNIGIRVNGIDTPELRGSSPAVKKLAQKAQKQAKQCIDSGKTIILRNIKRGKYFRVIADVEIDGVSLSKVMLDSGLAKPYDGGTRPNWEKVNVKTNQR